MARPVVLLPQPDSPTRPSVSPRLTVKRDVVDGPHPADLALQDDALGDREIHLEVLDSEELAVGSAVLGNGNRTGRGCHQRCLCLLDALCRGLSVWFAATRYVHPARDAMSGDDWLQARILRPRSARPRTGNAAGTGSQSADRPDRAANPRSGPASPCAARPGAGSTSADPSV